MVLTNTWDSQYTEELIPKKEIPRKNQGETKVNMGKLKFVLKYIKKNS